MNCPRCGTPATPGAAFCMRCGNALAPTGQPVPGFQPQPGFQQPQAFGSALDDQSRKQKTAAIIVGAVLMLAVVIFGLSAAGILKLGASAPEEVALRRVDKGPAPVLEKASIAPEPTMEKMAERKVMPDAVRNWLLHLERCERIKNELSIKQMADMAAFLPMLQTLGAGIGEMDPYDQTGDTGESPDKVTHSKFRDLKPEWEQLITFFASVPPPDEDCQRTADDYTRALSEIPGMTGDLQDVLNSVQADPSAALQRAMSMKKASYGDIDRYFEQTDVRVGEICRKYDENKWFNIRSDIGGGIMGQLGK